MATADGGGSNPKTSVYGIALPGIIPDDPIPIRVECIYIPVISHMDITLNTFNIKVDFDLSWDATPQDIENYQANPTTYIPSFVPDLVFSNSCSVDTDRIINGEKNIQYQMREGNRIYIRHRFIGTLTNRYTVENFPFDVQSLVVSMALSYYNKSQVYFEIPIDKPFVHVPKLYTAVPGFRLIKAVAGEVSPDNFSNVITIVQTERLRTPFFFRIFLPLLSINVASLSVYSLEEYKDKIDILITVMLTFVGMIYILSTLIPMAGKGTLFDKYAMASIMICAISIFVNSYTNNKVAFGVHVSLVGILHFFFFVKSYFCYVAANRKKTMTFDELAGEYTRFEPLTYPEPNKSLVGSNDVTNEQEI